MSTVPGIRAEKMARVAIMSLLSTKAARTPDCLLLVAARKYMRFPAASVNLTNILEMLPARHRHNPKLRTRFCAQDYGPGSKLLCALPVLRRLAWREPDKWFLILADDDKIYKPWALGGIESVFRQTSLNMHAFSYKVWELWWQPCGRAHGYCSGSQGSILIARRGSGPPSLRLGQGADMMAIPAHALLRRPRAPNGLSPLPWQQPICSPANVTLWNAHIEAVLSPATLSHDDSIQSEMAVSSAFDFFQCAMRVEPYLRFHDDLWISTFLHVQNLTMTEMPVDWTNVTHLGQHCWSLILKQLIFEYGYKQSSLVYMNQTIPLQSEKDNAQATGSKATSMRLTHFRVTSSSQRAFKRLLDECGRYA